MKRALLLCLFALATTTPSMAEDGEKLFYALRTKVLTVKDYTAQVKMKIDVSFLKVPLLRGTLLFKSPDKMRLERHGGISLLPKKNINLTLSNLIPTGNVTVIDMGNVVRDGVPLHLIKVVPEAEGGSIVLSKIWIDESRLVAVRAETTTLNDGTVVMDLTFGKYTTYGLPDRVTIFMDLKDFKLPKGVTMDYNAPTAPPEKPEAKTKGQKGTIQINYLSYDINKGIADEKFKG
jgi:hypothetical protein